MTKTTRKSVPAARGAVSDPRDTSVLYDGKWLQIQYRGIREPKGRVKGYRVELRPAHSSSKIWVGTFNTREEAKRAYDTALYMTGKEPYYYEYREDYFPTSPELSHDIEALRELVKGQAKIYSEKTEVFPANPGSLLLKSSSDSVLPHKRAASAPSQKDGGCTHSPLSLPQHLIANSRNHVGKQSGVLIEDRKYNQQYKNQGKLGQVGTKTVKDEEASKGSSISLSIVSSEVEGLVDDVGTVESYFRSIKELLEGSDTENVSGLKSSSSIDPFPSFEAEAEDLLREPNTELCTQSHADFICIQETDPESVDENSEVVASYVQFESFDFSSDLLDSLAPRQELFPVLEGEAFSFQPNYKRKFDELWGHNYS